MRKIDRITGVSSRFLCTTFALIVIGTNGLFGAGRITCGGLGGEFSYPIHESNAQTLFTRGQLSSFKLKDFTDFELSLVTKHSELVKLKPRQPETMAHDTANSRYEKRARREFSVLTYEVKHKGTTLAYVEIQLVATEIHVGSIKILNRKEATDRIEGNRQSFIRIFALKSVAELRKSGILKGYLVFDARPHEIEVAKQIGLYEVPEGMITARIPPDNKVFSYPPLIDSDGNPNQIIPPRPRDSINPDVQRRLYLAL